MPYRAAFFFLTISLLVVASWVGRRLPPSPAAERIDSSDRKGMERGPRPDAGKGSGLSVNSQPSGSVPGHPGVASTEDREWASGPGRPAPVTAEIPHLTAAIQAFARWQAMREREGAPFPAGAIEEGLALAQARREAMRQLIPIDPRQALAFAIPWRARQGLPPEIRAMLEQPVAGRGRFEVLCAYAPPGTRKPGTTFVRTFEMGERTFRAFVYGRRVGQQTTENAVLQGVAVDDLLAVDADPVRLLDADEADAALAAVGHEVAPICVLTGAAATRTTGGVLAAYGERLLPLAAEGLVSELNARLAATEPGFRSAVEPPAFPDAARGLKRLLFMRARFPDDVREPIGEAEAAEVMRLANEYFVAASYNSLSILTTVGPLVMLPQPKLYYSVQGPAALLRDAREATRAAGVEPDAFDLDQVRFETVPGFDWGGLASVGGKGVWLQSSGLGVICHELGHNLGLAHANFWNTVRPDPPPNPQNLPFDPDGLVGIDSTIGPGDDVEYGDPFDVMGSSGDGRAHFTGLHKYLLGWLPAGAMTTVVTNGLYRVYAHDAGRLGAGLTHLLRVRKDAERFYWIDARGLRPDNAWLANGVELHWNNWHQAIASAQLLDTTPGSGHGRTDAALTLGRTFADEAAQLFVTPVERGTTDVSGVPVTYYDVAIHFGPFPANRPPVLELTASALTVNVGQPVTLTASAQDPDGDAVSYSWDLGGGLPGASSAAVTQAWTNSGDYVVRCEISDLQGGTASAHVVIRVGFVGTLRVAGRVIDQAGEPLAGVRVHNGQAGTNGPYAPDYRWAYTDSEGRYTLTGLQPGSYGMGAVRGGYVTQPLNFSRPLILNRFTGVDVDFIATALPQASVTWVADGDEASGRPAAFRVSRTGTTNDALRVYFRLNGSATAPDDYTPWTPVEIQTNTIPTVLDPVSQEIEFGYVDLPPGIRSTNVALTVVRDAVAGEDETVSLTLAYPVTRTVVSDTETNIFDIPGWEVLSDNGQETWFQTRPRYWLGARDEATARILDATPPTETIVSIAALQAAASENAGDSASFLVTRSGRAPGRALIVPLALSGTATPGEDYEAPTSPIVLPPDAVALRITVNILDDRYVEGNETLTLTLGSGDGYRLGARSATVQIVDNDLPRVAVTATDPVVTETGSGARVTFQRTGDLTLALEVDYLLGGTATAGVDYEFLPGRITVPAGVSSVSLVVVPRDDSLLEGDESVEIHLGDSPVYDIAPPGRAVVTIRDDEFPIVTVETVEAEAIEGSQDGSFVIRRTGSTATPLVVQYRFGGSAVHQSDFVASGDRIEIPAGSVQTLLVVTPIDDAIREDDETIAIELLLDPAYTLGEPSQAAVLLLDNNDSQPAVGFALLTSHGLESRTDAELAVRISGNPDTGDENAVTVAWEALGGTATEGVDYVLTNGTLTFAYVDESGPEPYSNRVAIIPLLVIDDLLPERDENVVIRLRIAPTEIPSEDPESPPTFYTNGVLDVYAVHTYTIVDDDQAEIRVTAQPDSTAEGSTTPGAFLIERIGRTNAAQTIVLYLSGSAASGSDYLALPSYVTLAPGQASTNLLVVPIDDPLQEYREDVRLTLVSAPGARLGQPSSAIVWIDDNDGTLEFAAARYDANEGDGAARIEVRRTGDTSFPATVVFDASPGTAQPVTGEGTQATGDFYPTNGVLTFLPGEWLKTFQVSLRDDGEPEEPETVLLRLTRGSDLFPLGGQNTATLTILDDDALLSAGTNDVFAIEMDGVAIVTVTRSGPADRELVVGYATVGLSAVAGVDFLETTGEFVFPVGERAVSVRIPVLDDFDIEGDESFALRLSSADGIPLGEIPVTIVDDDCAIEFEAVATEVDEDAGVVELTVRRVGSPLMPVLVQVGTVSGTALAGADFVAVNGTLSFLGNRFEPLTNGSGEVEFQWGESNKVVTVPIINDAEGERDETFEVRLANPRSGNPFVSIPFVTLGSNSNIVVTIRDNEAPGRLDDAFQPGLGADAPVQALAVQTDGKILVGGDFATFDGVVLPRLARLHADGFVDQSFNPGLGFDGSVLAVAPVADGRILVGGSFAEVDGSPQAFLARLEPDGTRANGVAPTPNAPVRAIAGREEVFVGGDFTRLGALTRVAVARLTVGGDVDPGFDPGSVGVASVFALLPTGGGGVLVGGAFENWAGSGARNLVQLRADGAVDAALPRAFLPNRPVRALAAAGDGSVYLAGDFTEVGGLPRAGVARWLAGGGIDPGFDPGSGANAPVLAAAIQGAGRVVFAGAFDAFAGVNVGRFVRVDGDGGFDATFFRGSGANDTVRALAVQSDGAFLIGGDFTAVNDRPRRRIARIHSDEKFVEGFVEFTAPLFTVAEDGAGSEAVITVRRTGAAKGEARVEYFTADATATASLDYESARGELVFGVGQTNATFRVRALDDTLAEGSETVTLVLTNASGADLGRQSIATLVIEDNEAAVAFDLVDVEAAEDSGAVTLVVRRSGPVGAAAEVSWTTQSGTATAGEDFEMAAGRLSFGSGVATMNVTIVLWNDAFVEGPETFTVRLSQPSAGLALGTQSIATVTIVDDDRLPTHYTLTVQPSPGGLVVPSGGRYPTNTVVMLTALPESGFEFARWEGTVALADNPLSLLMDRNHVLTARFRPRNYLDDFETGDLDRLPWRTTGAAPWSVTRETASGGVYSARAGTVPNGGASVLSLTYETPAGGGSFDFRTATEAAWDFLEFRVNGELRSRWSGANGWQTYAFNVPAGSNEFEWRFTRDRTFGGLEDAVWIDNLDLPEELPPATPPRLEWLGGSAPCVIEVTGTPGRSHVLEFSADFRDWVPVAGVVAPAETFVLTDPACDRRGSAGFYRVRVE